ncbi:MAG: hypothetical protein LW650_02925 [Planctomycetaceae bacterium]|jgi:hypothetical protein|nr:hypothetical protein [Phycisphaerales bacterium]MCE2652471.1 hypothetical protein [Planctomycetaceae bacterium]
MNAMSTRTTMNATGMTGMNCMTGRRVRALLLVAGMAWGLVAHPAAVLGQSGASGGGAGGGSTGGGAAPAAVATTGMDALPITSITLYRSGVGSFLRSGQVTDDAKVQLRFDVSQINDVLKTMQVLDLSGGRVESVSYASKDPLARRMASFSLPIGDNPSMQSLLERLRGSVITLQLTEGTVNGTVLSTEVRKVPVAGTGPGGTGAGSIDAAFVNLVTGTGIRSVPIASIGSFQLADKALAEELNRALMALADSRGERSKAVEVTLDGAGKRNIVVGYVHETPVWKTTYRLLLPETEDAGSPAPQAVMQGWAIVENTTDQDWQNVRLSLVSGRPVSFTMDLYEPLYLNRPDVPVPTLAGVMPRNYDAARDAAGKPGEPGADAKRAAMRRGEGGTNGAPGRLAAAAAPMPSAGAPGSPGGGGGMQRLEESMATADGSVDFAAYGAKAAASAREVGEVFQFTLNEPVTIERQRSAMIPILSGTVGARRVSIYNPGDRQDFPMRGVEITNGDTQLLPGPLAVFDGSTYAGDATINQVAAKDKRLIAYAVDLEVNAETRSDSQNNLTKLVISQGTVRHTYGQRFTTTYVFTNKDTKRQRTIMVEHPRMDGWDYAGAKPVEESATVHRFEVKAEAGKTAELKVVQERTMMEEAGVLGYDMETLVRYRSEGKLSQAVLDAFKAVATKQMAVQEQERTVANITTQLDELRKEQTRVAGIMKDLDRNSDAYKNLLQKLNSQEKQIDELTGQQKSGRERLVTLQRELNAYIAGLSVE